MRRSGAALLGVVGGMLVGATLVRRRSSLRERVDLYYEDGSMVSVTDGPELDRLLPLAREILRSAR